jgi:hypothetical protein
MKKLTKVILKAVAVIGCAILLLGCNPTYKTILAKKEEAPTAVAIDGHADSGKVRRVYTDKAGRRIAEFTVGRDSEALIREGVLRVPGGSTIQLRTDLASGQLLPSGSFIRAESSLGVAAKKWGTKGLAVIALAAMAAVICLRRFLAFRAAAPFIPLLLAAGLAFLTAYSAHGLVVPVVSGIVQKVQTRAESSKVPTPYDEIGPSETGAAWANKARGVERDLIGFLRTPTDAPRLLAFVLTFAVTLPVFACLVAWFFRKLANQPIVCSLLFLTLAPVPLNAATGNPGVTFSKAFLSAEQNQVRGSLKEAEALLARAGRLLDAGAINEAAESVVHASLLLDSAQVSLANHLPKIEQLKSSPLSYLKSEEQKRLTAAHASLVETERRLDETATLRRKGLAKSALLKEYIAKREASRLKLTEGIAPLLVLSDLKTETIGSANRLARVITKTNVLEKIVAVATPPVTNWLVKTNTVEKIVPATMAPVTNVVIKTNVVDREVIRIITNIVEKPVTLFVTNIVIQQIPVPQATAAGITAIHETNITLPTASHPLMPGAALNNASTVATAGPSNTSSRAWVEPTVKPRLPYEPGAQRLTETTTPNERIVPATSKADARPKRTLITLAGTGVAALIGLALMGLVRWSRRKFDVLIAKVNPDGTTTATSLTLQSGTERIVLGEGLPRVEPSDLPQAVPASIVLDRFARAAIKADLARVILGEREASGGGLQLPIGEQVRIESAGNNELAEIYVLREITTAAGDEAELRRQAA